MPVRRALVVLLWCAAVGLAADPAKLQTLAGKTISGELVRIDEKAVVLRSEGKEVSTPISDVLQIDLHPAGSLGTTRYADLELTDGSLLHCSQVVLKGKQVELTVLPGLKVTAPLAAVSYVLHDAHDSKIRQEWPDFLAKNRGNRDVLVVKAEGVLNGLQGTFGEADDKGETIEFELTNGRKVRPNLARAQALIFVHRPDPAAPPALCKVHDTQRNLLVAAKVAVGPAGLRVTTVAGVQVDYPNSQQVSRLDYSRGKLAYLSDLEPAKVEEMSTEEAVFHYRRNQNLEGEPIQLAGVTYPKGLALHSYTALLYDLGGDYAKFEAILGVDDKVGGDSHVRVTFEGDGKELKSLDGSPASFVVKRGDKPRPVTVDVKGVKLLRIVVKTEELLDLGQHVDLANARVSK